MNFCRYGRTNRSQKKKSIYLLKLWSPKTSTTTRNQTQTQRIFTQHFLDAIIYTTPHEKTKQKNINSHSPPYISRPSERQTQTFGKIQNNKNLDRTHTTSHSNIMKFFHTRPHTLPTTKTTAATTRPAQFFFRLPQRQQQK